MSGCLDNCERGNTIVVVPSRLGRAAGGRVTWLGEMLDAATMAALTDWVRQGGPGHADTPTRLVDRLVARVVARRAASSD
jgi:(2Fe-2S) ferredoxin